MFCLLMSSTRVCLLFTLFKRCKKFCILKIILLQVLPSNIEIFANRIKWEFQIKGHRFKFGELSGGLPRAWFHRSLKVLKNGKYMGRYIEQNICYSP